MSEDAFIIRIRIRISIEIPTTKSRLQDLVAKFHSRGTLRQSNVNTLEQGLENRGEECTIAISTDERNYITYVPISGR